MIFVTMSRRLDGLIQSHHAVSGSAFPFMLDEDYIVGNFISVIMGLWCFFVVRDLQTVK